MSANPLTSEVDLNPMATPVFTAGIRLLARLARVAEQRSSHFLMQPQIH